MMPFYPQDSRRGPRPPRNRQEFGFPNQWGQEQPFFFPNQRRREDPFFYPNQGRQEQPFFFPNQGRREDPFFYPNQGRQEQPFFYPDQYQPSRFGNFPAQLNTIMGHAGTLTNGVNMMRQIGSLMSLFR